MPDDLLAHYPSFQENPPPTSNILYLDIGGTAIKSAIIPTLSPSNTLDYLITNEIPEPSRNEWSPHTTCDELDEILRNNLEHDFHKVLISITGERVSQDGRIYQDWLDLPKHLSLHVESTLNLPVGSAQITHDSLAWGRGIRFWMHQRKKSLSERVGILALGNAVAFSIITDAVVAAIDINDNIHDWTAFRSETNCGNDSLHNQLADPYFKWRQMNLQSHEREENTRGRFQIALNELNRVHNLGSFIFAGGNAANLAGCHFDQPCFFLPEETLSFPPGFIPLLGML